MATSQHIRSLKDAKSGYTVFLGIAITFAAALYFRIEGIDFGLPEYPHPDEAAYLPNAIRIIKSENLNPRYFNNPPLFTYLLILLVKLVYWISELSGTEQSFNDFVFHEKASLKVYARLIIAVFGAATSLVIYRIGSLLQDSFTGVASALFIALCFLHVRDSHYAVNDVLMTFFVSCSFLGCVSISCGSGIKTYIWTGIVIGLAVATKYNAGIVIVPLFLAHMLRPKGFADVSKSGLFVALFSAFLAFTIVCPWYILETKAFFKGFFNQLQMGKNSWYGQSDEYAAIFYIKTLLWGYGYVPMLVALLGAVSVTCRSKRQTIVLLSFPVLYICSMLLSNLFFVRFMIPVLPFLAVLSGIGLSTVSNTIANRWQPRVPQVITTILFILTFLQGFVFIVRHNDLISIEDNRFTANRWTSKHILKNSVVLYTPYSPIIDKYNLREMVLGRRQRVGDLEKLSEAYAIVSSYYRCRSLLYPRKYPELDKVFWHIEKHGTLLYESSDQDFHTRCYDVFSLDNIYSPFWNLFSINTPGPELKVYRLNKRFVE